MIRAVFFDWFYTLAHFEPQRHLLYKQAFSEVGIDLPPEKIVRSMLITDEYFYAENTKSAVAKRSPEEQLEVYLHYPLAILADAAIDTPEDTSIKILKVVQESFKGTSFALFDDVLPALKLLRKRGLTTGLITNLNRDMPSICRELGLDEYLDFIVTSAEAGVDKPDPTIFTAALKKAGLKAREAVHVGDQYQIDVVGARGVGINPVFIDRYDIYPAVNDCPRIMTLVGLEKHL
ncbi:HAD family hydrolase [Chloroflexota bacterium]